MSRGRFAAWTVMPSWLALISLSAAAFAQTELRIARPLDGATVRETVNILVPAWCVPEGGFITCVIDGQFKCAAATRSEDGRYFVYRWDTKAIETSPETGTQVGRARDGRHTITVEAYDSTGKRVGSEQQIAVYVKNSASADMPAGGLKLRYNNKVGSASKYKFRYAIDLKNIEGATHLTAALGEAVEGAEGVVKLSVEDRMPDSAALIRQKLVGTLLTYQGGQSVPAVGLIPKAYYHVQDSLGRVTYVMSSSSSGTGVSIDLPNLPSQPVRIGDTWTATEKVFRDCITGNSAVLTVNSTLEGLEWEGGHPCAKIRTTFSGAVKIPFSAVLTQPIPMSGETITYFAYAVGKVISSVTRAVAEPRLDRQVMDNLTRSLVSRTGSSASPEGFMPGSLYGTPAMEGSATGYATQSQGTETVKVKLEVTQSLELVQ